MLGWDLAVALGAQSVVIRLFTPTRCECYCGEAASVDDRAFQLLERQLDRCGPANLTVPLQPACPSLPELPSQLWAVTLGFILGIFTGCAFYAVLVGRERRPPPALAAADKPLALPTTSSRFRSAASTATSETSEPTPRLALTPSAKRAAHSQYGGTLA